MCDAGTDICKILPTNPELQSLEDRLKKKHEEMQQATKHVGPSKKNVINIG